jgi:hypothetical protein
MLISDEQSPLRLETLLLSQSPTLADHQDVVLLFLI